MNRFTIFCTKTQTCKALELGAPIEAMSLKESSPNSWIGKAYIINGNICALPPTAEQMIGWLRKEMKLAISIGYNIQNDNTPVWFYSIFNVAYSNTFSEPEEATLAAIDAALDCLITNKK